MRIFHKSIREMKIHKRTQHEPDESKCDLCAFRANDHTSLRKHEDAKHGNIVLECKQLQNLGWKQFISTHWKQACVDIKCEQCNFEMGWNDVMKRHMKAVHTLKTCNECEFSTSL